MPINLTEDKKQQILDSNDIVTVIEAFLPLKRNGSNYMANCPFHKEKTPSFVVSKDKQIYKCFGCGKSGNVIGFLMEHKNWTYIETIEYLASKAGIILDEYQNSEEANRKKQTLNLLHKINKDAALFFYSNLLNQKIPLNYLKERNIEDNVIKKFGLGYSFNQWDKLLNHLKNKGYAEDDIQKTGLILLSEKSNRYYDRFRNRIIFPIIDVKKRVIGFGGRVLDDSLPKYLNSPESMVFSKGYNLYGLNLARDSVKDKTFYLVEGYMDVIKMHTYGFDTAVAALGTSLTENQIKLMNRYSNKFNICFDSDSAGLDAALRAINLFKKQGLDANVTIVNNAKDPDEFLNKFGKSAFELLLNKSFDYYGFLEFYYKDLFLVDKIRYISKFFENIRNVKGDVEKEIILGKLSSKVDVSKEALLSEFNKKHSSSNLKVDQEAKKITKPLVANKKNTTLVYEEKLVKILLIDNDLAFLLNEFVYDDDFGEYKYLEFFKNIYHNLIEGNEFTTNTLKDTDFENVNISDKELNANDDLLKSVFLDCLMRLKVKHLEFIKNNLNKNLIDSTGVAEKTIFIEKIMNLAKKIKSLKEEAY